MEKTLVVIKRGGTVVSEEVEAKNLWLYYEEMVKTYGQPKFVKAIYPSKEMEKGGQE